MSLKKPLRILLIKVIHLSRQRINLSLKRKIKIKQIQLRNRLQSQIKPRSPLRIQNLLNLLIQTKKRSLQHKIRKQRRKRFLNTTTKTRTIHKRILLLQNLKTQNTRILNPGMTISRVTKMEIGIAEINTKIQISNLILS